MKLKQILFSGLFLAIVASSSFAAGDFYRPTTNLEKKVKKELSKIDFDYSELNGETLKIRFTVNEKSEIIVLSTDNSNLDATIKGALNYDKIESGELKPFEIYILPVTFEKS